MHALARNRGFVALWLASCVSTIGDGIFLVALTWWIALLTGSALSVGVALIIDALPMLLLAPFAGNIADRLNRRLLLIIVNFLMALPLAIAVPACWSGRLSVPWTYVLLFCLSTIGTLKFPAANALLVDHLTMEQRQQGNALMQSTYSISRLLGPAIGGLLLAWGGTWLGFLADALSFIMAALILFSLPATQTPMEALARAPGQQQGFFPNLKAMWREPLLRDLLTLTCVGQFLTGPIVVLLPILVERVLDAGPQAFGTMSSLIGVGAVLSGLGMLPRGFSPHTLLRLTLPLALGGIAIATATLAASQGVAMAAVASLAWGVCDNIAELSLLTITQKAIPLDRRGLFFGVLGSAIMAARQIGLATAGLVADAVGTRVALMTCAALLLLPALFSATRKLEKGTDNVTAD